MEKFFKISTASILVPLLFALYSPSAGWAQTVSIAGYRVITSPTPVKPGESITFSWQAPSDHSTRDWIGLFLNFQPSNGATTLKLKFVPSGTSGFITMTTPATQNGLTYELRYFLKDGWTEAARSNPITVSSNVMYVKLARTEEREALAVFGDEWRAYAAAVPAFAPRLRALVAAQRKRTP